MGRLFQVFPIGDSYVRGQTETQVYSCCQHSPKGPQGLQFL